MPVHLVDRARPDPWQSGRNHREPMVSVYGPTTRAAGHPAAPYMLPEAAAHFDSVTADDYIGIQATTSLARAVRPGPRSSTAQCAESPSKANRSQNSTPTDTLRRQRIDTPGLPSGSSHRRS